VRRGAQILKTNEAGDALLMPPAAVRREIEYSSNLAHPNIVQLLNVIKERSQLVLVVT
jgi:serine/threonine protein kinase